MASEGTHLLILGAGCSVDYGFPLASGFTDHLEKFRDECNGGREELRRLVDQTLSLFQRLKEVGSPADSIDQVARLVHQGKLGDRSAPANRVSSYSLVEDAKAAIAAMFRAKEADAVKTGLPAYRNLLYRIFPSDYGTGYRLALSRTPFRVLTFNYDRLFELAFKQHFVVDDTQAFYGSNVLNSGLYHASPSSVEIHRNRFSYLKLHGTVGVSVDEWGGEPSHTVGVPDPARPEIVLDDGVFGNDLPQTRSTTRRPRAALIVFPHEKDHLQQYPNNRFPYRAYIPEVWDAARAFASQATTIEFIGYSCPYPDLPAWRSLLDAAKNCRRILIQNPTADRICRNLKRLLPEKAGLLTADESRFGD